MLSDNRKIVIQKCIKNGWECDENPQLFDESLLEYKEGSLNNNHEYTTWQEWYLDGKIVKRAAQVNLKHNVAADAIAGMFA